jgi:hypothetical protein
MAVYLAVSTDAFAETRAVAARQRVVQQNVRRPLRGIQVKPNTYASIRVKTASGADIKLLDSSSDEYDASTKIGRSSSYANFLIQSLRESRAEKQQIIETFGEDYVYFFGERPRFLEVQGVLINSADFNWKSEFWTNYDQHLRGTKLVEQNARLYFYFDDTVVEGYLLGASTTEESMQPHLMPFNFQLFITNYAILSNVGSVIFGASDTGENGKSALEPILPTGNPQSAIGASLGAGGLTGFLANTAKFANDATFTIQRTLETIRNTFYGRELIVPDGIGTMVVAPAIENKGQFAAARTGQPIHTMGDEYVARSPQSLDAKTLLASKAEQARIEALLLKQDPVALELQARAEFQAAGIDTGKPNAMMAILGRGAFAAVQYAAPFGLAKVSGGKIGQADQAISSLP